MAKLYEYQYMRIKILFYYLLWFIGSQAAYAFSPYSNEELDELQKEFVQQINQSDSVMRNPLATQYINQIGLRLSQAGHIEQPYYFIVKSNEINAFAGPGGYIGVNSALINATSNESELAGVMAHELAHVRLEHLYRMIEHQKQMRIPMLASLLASAALGMIDPMLGSGAMMASLTGVAQNNINFTRAAEKEADRLGIDMLIKAGYNPKGMVSFFKKMQMNSRYYYTANIPAILRDHPLDEERIAEAQNRSMNVKSKPQPANPDYFLFKQIVYTSVNADPKQQLDYYQQACNKHTPKSACEYGYVLALNNAKQFANAKAHIQPLFNEAHDNLFYLIALSDTELGLHDYGNALALLANAHANHPDNYATLMAYANGLIQAQKADKAVSILLKGSRQYKRDLPLCLQLAQAQADAHRKDYAYFTQAQCQLLQGLPRAAMNQLKIAKKLATADATLEERITAKMDEIKFMLE